MLGHYSEPEELLADDTFLDWYFKTGKGGNEAWEKWMAADAGNKAMADQAVRLLELTTLREKKIPAGQLQRATDRLLADISRTDAAHRLPFYGGGRWIAAACILGAIVTGMLLYRAYYPGHSEIRTEYGQLGQQTLPDGTEVTMNANSRLKYSTRWKPGADREVWIAGEAFFHVRKTPEKSRFIVHLNDCDVIVTGTQFNVVNRPGKENVMLEEGSVRLHAGSGREINLVPGDFVTVNGNDLEKRPARPDSLTAWTTRKLVFDNTPLPDLVDIVYDQYGVRLQLAGDSPEKKTVSGIMPNNNLEVLLKSLQASQGYEVIKGKDGVITIVAKPAGN